MEYRLKFIISDFFLIYLFKKEKHVRFRCKAVAFSKSNARHQHSLCAVERAKTKALPVGKIHLKFFLVMEEDLKLT